MKYKTLSPEQMAQLVELLPIASSLREISREMNERQDTIRIAAQPLIAIMQAMGALPPCDCGKERYHSYGCSVRAKRYQPEDHFPGHTVAETAVILAKRRAVVEALIAGKRLFEINAEMGFRHNDARQYLRFLTPAQLAMREQRLAERGLFSRASRPDAQQTKESIL